MLVAVVKNGGMREEDLLKNLPPLGAKKSCPVEAQKVIGRLVQLGLLERCSALCCSADDIPLGGYFAGPEELRQPIQDILQAPVTVHWAVTYNCRSRCPDCYVRRHRDGDSGEMNTAEAHRAVAALADWGVFQLAIGGGEPFLRPDLPDLTAAAARSGMVVHITTGVAELQAEAVEQIAPSVKMLQLSVDEHRLVEEPEKEMSRLRCGVQTVTGVGLKTGANLKVSKTTLANFGVILERLEDCGFDRITLLRYKPPPSWKRWIEENPSAHTLLAFELFLAEAVSDFPHITFRVDCAFAFLFRHLKPSEAKERGIHGCTAAQRIAALDPQGNLLPCSQLYAPRFKAGNILEEEPAQIWCKSRVFKRYRYFREKGTFKKSECGLCLAQAHCGGCRVFASDARGADPFCPEPIWPSLNLLGKQGRKLDLVKHMKSAGSIRVKEYMERYGVGLKTAVKELNSSFLEKLDSGAKGNQKNDLYAKHEYNLIQAIQDVTGYTSGGLPFVSDEEVAAWLEEEQAREYRGDYPRWLLDGGEERRWWR